MGKFKWTQCSHTQRATEIDLRDKKSNEFCKKDHHSIYSYATTFSCFFIIMLYSYVVAPLISLLSTLACRYTHFQAIETAIHDDYHSLFPYCSAATSRAQCESVCARSVFCLMHLLNFARANMSGYDKSRNSSHSSFSSVSLSLILARSLAFSFILTRH